MTTLTHRCDGRRGRFVAVITGVTGGRRTVGGWRLMLDSWRLSLGGDGSFLTVAGSRLSLVDVKGAKRPTCFSGGREAAERGDDPFRGRVAPDRIRNCPTTASPPAQVPRGARDDMGFVHAHRQPTTVNLQPQKKGRQLSLPPLSGGSKSARSYCLPGIVVGSLVFMSIIDAEVMMFVPFTTVTVAKPQSTSGRPARLANGAVSCTTWPAGTVRS